MAVVLYIQVVERWPGWPEIPRTGSCQERHVYARWAYLRTSSSTVIIVKSCLIDSYEYLLNCRRYIAELLTQRQFISDTMLDEYRRTQAQARATGTSQAEGDSTPQEGQNLPRDRSTSRRPSRYRRSLVPKLRDRHSEQPQHGRSYAPLPAKHPCIPCLPSRCR